MSARLTDANGIGEVGNAKCGDIMRIYLKVDDNDVITDVKFKTFGCGAAIATSSMVTEMVKGKNLDGSAGNFQSGCGRSPGRLAAGEDALFQPGGRRSA